MFAAVLLRSWSNPISSYGDRVGKAAMRLNAKLENTSHDSGCYRLLKVLDGNRVQAALPRQPLRLTYEQGCHTLASCLTFWRLAFPKGP